MCDCTIFKADIILPSLYYFILLSPSARLLVDQIFVKVAIINCY